MYSPSIPFLPSESRNVMFCIPPNLFCRPPLCAMRFVRDGNGPQDAFGVGERGRFDVQCPSLAEEGGGDVGQGLALGSDEDRAEDMITMLQLIAWEVVDSGCSCCQNGLEQEGLPLIIPYKAVFSK